MSSRGEIPGFYYDEEKGKYFRIQPNHEALGLAHSREAITEKAKSQEALAQKHDRQSRERSGRIKRSAPTLLSLRHGIYPKNHASIIQAHYAEGLICHVAKAHQRREVISLTFTKGQLYAVLSLETGAHQVQSLTVADALGTNLHPSQSCPGRTRAEIYDANQFVAFCGSELLGGNLGSLTNNVTVSYQFNQIVWDCASPSSDGIQLPLAVAIEGGLLITPDFFIDDIKLCTDIEKEQMTVTFQDRHIVMSGGRDGIVYFTDIRSGTSIARLKHSSAVTGICLGRSNNHIIVSGLTTTALYDLRRTPGISKPNPASHKASKKHQRPPPDSLPSPPLVTFHVPPDRQSDSYGEGKVLQYLPSLDIAVVVSHKLWIHRVTLYDASTGRILRSPLTSAVSPQPIHSLEVGCVRAGEPESIFIGMRDEVMEWTVTRALYRYGGRIKLVKDPFPPTSGWHLRPY